MQLQKEEIDRKNRGSTRRKSGGVREHGIGGGRRGST